MTIAEQLTLFDYAVLDAETRIVVQQRTSEIKALMKRAATDIIEIGQKLIEVKMKLGHGSFQGWIKSEFDWTRQTAYRFISVAERFGDCNNLLQMAPSALYLLAAPSTPDSARQEALDRAGAGESITYTRAADIVADHKEQQINERRYDGFPQVFPPGDDEPLTPYEQQIAERYEANRRQQIAVITGSSESNEWYTPTHIIDLARQVLGEIDLDPASSAAANDVIQASSFCTITEDGYAQQWGHVSDPVRVWLNPPYGKEDNERETNAIRWARKLIAEYESGRVSAAILLVKAALGYNWFEDLWYAYPTCLLRKRLSFVRADGSDDGQSKHATALIYFGQDVPRFKQVFSMAGRVVLPDD